MSRLKNFEDARTALASFIGSARTSSAGYNLDRMRRLMLYLDNPQEKMSVIHVAGTSGKTSTCYYVAALLQGAGKKVGLTISPHVDEVNERAQVNLKPLPEDEYCQELSIFLELIGHSGLRPTYFEVTVAFAFWLFAKHKVDYAVVEVGLGGLLDGTNVISRSDKVCIITDIGLDHTHILGKTYVEIAYQKAGIIKQGNHVFMIQQRPQVVDVVRDVCKSQAAHLHLIKRPKLDPRDTMPLFQQRNWYLANQVVLFLLNTNSMPWALGTRETLVPARMEAVQLGNTQVILDGSHNSQKITALVDSVQAKYPGRRMVLLISFGTDKLATLPASLEQLHKLSDTVITTSFLQEQHEVKVAINAKVLADYCDRTGFTDVVSEPDPAIALELALSNNPYILLVTGSYFLLNYVRPTVLQLTGFRPPA